MSLYMELKQQSASLLSEFHLIERKPSVFDEMSPSLKIVKYKAVSVDTQCSDTMYVGVTSMILLP